MPEKNIQQYLGRQTLVAGAVNAGKTTRTEAVVQQFLAAGYGQRMVILDLAPDPLKGVGGKLWTDKLSGVTYLTDKIHAPRLMGKDSVDTLALAKENAQTIEHLFSQIQCGDEDILILNDVTLYLQAGDLKLLCDFLNRFSTKFINAYYGNSFDDSDLSRRERELTEALMEMSDEVIVL